mmetsp:Transcript_12555/g.18762  ORF Transcript_12555/g.18762 Transcript_12555/m.18762 type:complete len:231 (+) Transcript_12555:36-728(+)
MTLEKKSTQTSLDVLFTRPHGKAELIGDDRSDKQLPILPRPSPRLITMEEVKKHAVPEDGWIAVGGKVFDITNFAKYHPGMKNGAQTSTVLAIKRALGTDCTTEFRTIHNLDSRAMLTDYYIGELADEALKEENNDWMTHTVALAFQYLKARKEKKGYMSYLQAQLQRQQSSNVSSTMKAESKALSTKNVEGCEPITSSSQTTTRVSFPSSSTIIYALIIGSTILVTFLL